MSLPVQDGAEGAPCWRTTFLSSLPRARRRVTKPDNSILIAADRSIPAPSPTMGAPILQSGRPSHGQKFEVYEEEEEPELWMAAAQGDVARVQRLVESGADVAWADTFGSTALHCACTNGHAVCARLLITARASVDQTNKNLSLIHI